MMSNEYGRYIVHSPSPYHRRLQARKNQRRTVNPVSHKKRILCFLSSKPLLFYYESVPNLLHSSAIAASNNNMDNDGIHSLSLSS